MRGCRGRQSLRAAPRGNQQLFPLMRIVALEQPLQPKDWVKLLRLASSSRSAISGNNCWFPRGAARRLCRPRSPSRQRLLVGWAAIEHQRRFDDEPKSVNASRLGTESPQPTVLVGITAAQSAGELSSHSHAWGRQSTGHRVVAILGWMPS